MPFDWDFLPSLTKVKQLKLSGSSLTLASFSNLRRESIASQTSAFSAVSSALYDTIEEERSRIQESFSEQMTKETYVQPGMKDMKIIMRYLTGEIDVPDEVVITWLPGYIPKQSD